MTAKGRFHAKVSIKIYTATTAIFYMTMIPLNIIWHKCKGQYQFTDTTENVIHFYVHWWYQMIWTKKKKQIIFVLLGLGFLKWAVPSPPQVSGKILNVGKWTVWGYKKVCVENSQVALEAGQFFLYIIFNRAEFLWSH